MKVNKKGWPYIAFGIFMLSQAVITFQYQIFKVTGYALGSIFLAYGIFHIVKANQSQ